MLSEEEKKAIEKLSNGEKIELISLIRVFKKEGIENFVITRKEYIDTVLNLITKLQKENKEKDKQIDLMAEESVEAHKWFYSKFYNFTKEDFIKYFEKLVKEKVEDK